MVQISYYHFIECKIDFILTAEMKYCKPVWRGKGGDMRELFCLSARLACFFRENHLKGRSGTIINGRDVCW